ncbi:Seripauperin-20 [Saccharomyces cerevisiae]|nr:Seripauperin-20 [Saccharomyces cerevisiae]
MVKLTSIAAGVAAIAATASATTTLAQSDERVNLVELGVNVSDIRAHLPNNTCSKPPTQLKPTQSKLLKPFSTTVTSPPC